MYFLPFKNKCFYISADNVLFFCLSFNIFLVNGLSKKVGNLHGVVVKHYCEFMELPVV